MNLRKWRRRGNLGRERERERREREGKRKEGGEKRKRWQKRGLEPS